MVYIQIQFSFLYFLSVWVRDKAPYLLFKKMISSNDYISSFSLAIENAS